MGKRLLLDLRLVHKVVDLDDGDLGAILDALSQLTRDEDDVAVVGAARVDVSAERLDLNVVSLGDLLDVRT